MNNLLEMKDILVQKSLDHASKVALANSYSNPYLPPYSPWGAPYGYGPFSPFCHPPYGMPPYHTPPGHPTLAQVQPYLFEKNPTYDYLNTQNKMFLDTYNEMAD